MSGRGEAVQTVSQIKGAADETAMLYETRQGRVKSVAIIAVRSARKPRTGWWPASRSEGRGLSCVCCRPLEAG